jgi:alpha-1,2-mannosyltransferase
LLLTERRAPAPTITLPTWMLMPGVAVALASVAAFGLLHRVIGWGPYDLSIFLMGGTAWTGEMPVYEQALPNGGHYTYPPITLLAFGPLSHLPLGAAHAVMIAAGGMALASVVWLTMRAVGVRPTAGMVGAALGLTGAALWLQPVHDTLDQGQVNLLLMLLVVADFALSGKRWHGALIGVATAIKLTPAIFVIYLLLIGRTRAAITAASVAVGLTVVGFLIAPGDSIRYWLHGAFLDTAWMIAPVSPGDVSNQWRAH